MRERAIKQGHKLPYIPPQVKDLPPREREIAEIIYGDGAMTAKSVGDRVYPELSNSALRSMLTRLCAKGILRREKLTGSRIGGDRKIPFVYFPSITVDAMRHSVLRQITRDYFDGSLLFVLWTAIELLNDDLPVDFAKRLNSSAGKARLHIAA